MDTKVRQKNPHFQVRSGNTLKHNITTGEKTLNDIPLRAEVFYKLVTLICFKYPGCLIVDQPELSVWFFPHNYNLETQEFEELENGQASSEAATTWTENQNELQLSFHSN